MLYFMHIQVPLYTRHGAEPFGAFELAHRGKAFTVLTFKHWKSKENRKIVEKEEYIFNYNNVIFVSLLAV